MKKVLVMLLLVLVAAYAVDRNMTRIQTVLPNPDDNQAQTTISPFAQSTTPVNPTPYNLLTGRAEVIGWTSWDWQQNGPVASVCRVDPVGNGIHDYWIYSLIATSASRNQYYNFYDFGSHTWSFPAGNVVFSLRSGYGGFDYDPITGCATPSTHQSLTAGITPVVGRDAAPGAGLFDYTSGSAVYEWPMNGVTHDEKIHVIAIDPTTYGIYYWTINPWGTWSTPSLLSPLIINPAFPDHNIVASKTSNKVAALWVVSTDSLERGYYVLSTDGGTTWGDTTRIPFPPSTIANPPSFYITSMFGCFDISDNLHIVADVSNGTTTTPVEIWHYCAINNPAWKLIYHYAPDTLAGECGYNALCADRPSIAQDPTTHNFYVTWEQFDSLNYEPTAMGPNGFPCLRADIWAAELTNDGQTLTRLGKITDANTTSKRFACVGGAKNDTVFVQYLVDSIAGMGISPYLQGRETWNPVVLQRFSRFSLPLVSGIEEGNPQIYNFALTSATPNPSNFNTRISYSLPTTGNIDLTVYDVLGRSVNTLVSGTKTAGEYNTIWNGRDNNGNKVQAGVYFYTLKTSGKSISRKLIRTN